MQHSADWNLFVIRIHTQYGFEGYYHFVTTIATRIAMIIVWVFVFIKRSNCKFLKSASSTVPHHGKNYACNALWERNEVPQKLDFLFEITSFLLWGLPQETYPAIKVSIGCLARVIASTAARTRNKCRVRPPMKPARACSQTMTDERKCSVGTMVDLSLLAFLISCSSTHMTNSILVITETLSVSASFLITPAKFFAIIHPLFIRIQSLCLSFLKETTTLQLPKLRRNVHQKLSTGLNTLIQVVCDGMKRTSVNNFALRRKVHETSNLVSLISLN